ncbi:MAG: rRNA pseudouridine synthase [Chthoniobacterales bacterium]|nr:rRNA pseudouridine synthase [Chthoniobacterales bacterium]
MRINQYLAEAGLGSRRGCERLVLEGRVWVNGAVVRTLSVQIQAKDRVEVDGRVVQRVKKVWFALYKPKGFLTTCSDPQERQTVLDLVSYKGRLFPVGRLDKESEGLVLLTNDGQLAQRLLHPRYGVEKEYEVVLDKEVTEKDKARLLRGFPIEGGRGRFDKISGSVRRKIGGGREVWKVYVVLRQGIKRQIRQMFYRLGYEVLRLKRIRIGPIELRGLGKGEFRPLTLGEVSKLHKISQAEKESALGKAEKSN